MKKIFLVLLSIIIVASMSGCSLVPSVELTESEQKVIAEYAAGLLLKHDKNYAGSIKKIEEEEEEEDTLDVIAEPEHNEMAQDVTELEESNGQEYNDPEFSEDLTASSDAMEEDVDSYSDMTISEAIGTDGFDIIYKTYEVQKIYPPEESEDLVFSLEAAPGMELLVLHFGITNDMPDRAVCDVLDSDTSFRVVLNGGERVQAQKTMLLNDLGSYYDELEGYGMIDSVLVFEVSEGSAASIQSLDLVVKRDGESSTHRLR